MIITFGSKKYPNGASNKDSCKKLAIYLEKENEGKPESCERHFFSHFENDLRVEEVVDSIDTNIKKLGKNDSKYFLMNICPSAKELHAKPKDQSMDEFLMNYTRNLMQLYAENFKKGLSGEDIMYFAKIEEFRYDEKTKKQKPDLNYHVHVIISRRDINQKYKLSPMTNHRNSKNGVIQGGFDRCAFFKGAEQLYSEMTRVERKVEETFEYRNAKKKERIQLVKEARMSDKPKLDQSEISKKSESTPLKLDLSFLFPPIGNPSMNDFQEEEFLRKKKKRSQGLSM
jgi:hypothetical protein